MKITEDQKRWIKNKMAELDNEISVAVWDYMKDEDEADISVMNDGVLITKLKNCDGDLVFYRTYADEDGLVYEDEECDFFESPLEVKLVIYKSLIRK